MRMKLSMLFIMVSMIAFILGILFMTPLVIAGAFCLITMCITPAVWLTGIIYGRGIWRAFFIGGMLTGFVPHFVIMVYALLAGTQSLTSVADQGLNLGVETEQIRPYRLGIAIVWSIPGVFAIAGGMASMVTYRILRGRDTTKHSDSFESEPLKLQ